MLKIKDNVDLKILEKKYGFKYMNYPSPNELYRKKVYLEDDNDSRILYSINEYGDRIIQILRFDANYLDDTLYDLIQDGLVEKV